MIELSLFAASFATVFLLVFQQQNVIHRNRWIGSATSIAIGAAQLTLWRVVPEASLIQLAAALAGGPVGFNAALWAHPILLKRRNGPATVSQDWHDFVKSLLDPERFGWSVSQEVRDRARRLLGIGGR